LGVLLCISILFVRSFEFGEGIYGWIGKFKELKLLLDGKIVWGWRINFVTYMKVAVVMLLCKIIVSIYENFMIHDQVVKF
jgi:hypothetical protein